MAPDSFSPSHSNPFSSDIFPGETGLPAKPLVLHRQAQAQLDAFLDEAQLSPPDAVRLHRGRIILLKAPRAGFGKSQLLHQWSASARAAASFVPLSFDPDQPLAWKPLLDQTLAALHQPAADSGLSALDQVARRTFARTMAALIRSRDLPCAQPVAALAALETRPLALFDFADPDQSVARWLQQHFEQLLPPAVKLLSAEIGLSEPAAALWWRAFCAYAQAGAARDPLRLDALRWALQQPTAAVGPAFGGLHFLQAPPADDASHQQTLGELCRLAAASRPLIFLLDHLDTFHGSSGKALRLAKLLNEWRHLSGRTRFVLSVNQDLWSQTFLKALPSALADRLADSPVDLPGLTHQAAEDLLRQRLATSQVPQDTAERFLAHFALDSFFAPKDLQPLAPRALLRHASQAWLHPWPSPPAAPEPLAPAQSPPQGIPDPLLNLSPEQAAQRRFCHLRSHFSAFPSLGLEPDRLFHLMKLSGQRLPLVRFEETPLPALVGAVVGIWESPGTEVLFGTEPYEDRPYWSALLAFAQARCPSAPASRLVVFSAAATPANPQDWIPQDEIPASRPSFLDLQTLDHPQLAALYAADEVLRECEAGSLPLASADGFAAMAPHLEGLWKRLTRPLAPAP